MSALTFLLAVVALLVPSASAIACYTAYVNRVFSEIQTPAGQFGPYPDDDPGYVSCITYSVNGVIDAEFIDFP
eukprot:gene26800-4392_t